MPKFCPECGASVVGMKFCAECGTPLDDAAAAEQTVARLLSHDEQVAVLEKQIAELADQGWHVYGRPTPFEVTLTRKSGLLARQFLPLWVEGDGTLWTNGFGVVTGGRIWDIPSLFSTKQPAMNPQRFSPELIEILGNRR